MLYNSRLFAVIAYVAVILAALPSCAPEGRKDASDTSANQDAIGADAADSIAVDLPRIDSTTPDSVVDVALDENDPEDNNTPPDQANPPEEVVDQQEDIPPTDLVEVDQGDDVVIPCGDGSCNPQDGENCATCAQDCQCTQCGEECVEEACTFTACEGKQCGDDGCGGTCGSCIDEAPCIDGQCCTPSCTDKCSGADDGCGGVCAQTQCDGCCANGECKKGNSVLACGSQSQECQACDLGTYCPFNACLAVPETWTDTTTGLIWQVEPTGGYMKREDAAPHCSALDLDGMGWRLPTISELRSLLRGCPATIPGGGCSVADGGCLDQSCGMGCMGCGYYKGPGSENCFWPNEVYGSCANFTWSSTEVANDNNFSWAVSFENAGIGTAHSSNIAHVRCVR